MGRNLYPRDAVMLGIIAAMNEELAAIVAQATIERTVDIGGRRFHVGELQGHAVVLVVSRIGKVAAASTATILLERFAVTQIVFTGLAGGVAEHLRVGDIVIADALIQHDLDARPLFARHEVPNLGLRELPTHPTMRDDLHRAALQFTATPSSVLTALGIITPVVYRGVIASGDQFFASVHAVTTLRHELPNVLAVEMEGAAVAQVCVEHALPFAVIRVISDTADHAAAIAFSEFLENACGIYAIGIVAPFLQNRRSLSLSGAPAYG
ncbi:MAG: 5'-methylthioadenosine/adenosylhomocysteine nucleosidase [Kofleriaceae bacterium]|nr:5'-methylthioadenosine/adenosylhomocysteine nucleosidase [Kofleriaceae bacterium]